MGAFQHLSRAVAVCLLVTAVLCAGCTGETREVTCVPVGTIPHQTPAFTQGLVYADGRLYESTGGFGESVVRVISPAGGAVILHEDLPDRFFGEGVTVWHSSLIQLSWRSGTGFVRDAGDLSVTETFSYEGEGWGLTHDGHRLIMSDGTATLQFLDPETFACVSTLEVIDGDRPVPSLNELEYIRGYIFANVWQTDLLVVIDPATGRVVEWIDLGPLREYERGTGAEALNGIAYDGERDLVLVTGKHWSRIYILEITGLWG
ncbi:MAG: glutaminyl-peptide cyclotransferase [Methanomicrobiales archaeon]